MAIKVDPEQNELRALRRLGGWRGSRVIEIGCGEGRLTERLASLGAQVFAIDPDKGRLKIARENLPAKYAERIRYQRGTALSVRRRSESFDRAVFAWAL